MKILALDTSTEYCSVALWRDGEVDARETLAGQRHSELLLPMVDDLLRRHGLAVKSLDGIAYGRGPGSFTGLRIACGVVQGLAFGAGLGVVGVVTLAAMAQAAGADSGVDRLVCCLDARMGEIYHAAYVRSGTGWEAAQAPGLHAPADLPLPPPGTWAGCGSGFAAHGEALQRRFAGRLSAIMPEIFPHARDIARLAQAEFAAGRAVAPEQAVPLYIRDKVALKTHERAT